MAGSLQPARDPLGYGRGEPADTGLHDNMCRTRMPGSRYLIAELRRYDAVPRHDDVNDRIIRIVGRVGNKDAAVPSRGSGRVNGVVVGPRHPNDLGT